MKKFLKSTILIAPFIFGSVVFAQSPVQVQPHGVGAPAFFLWTLDNYTATPLINVTLTHTGEHPEVHVLPYVPPYSSIQNYEGAYNVNFPDTWNFDATVNGVHQHLLASAPSSTSFSCVLSPTALTQLVVVDLASVATKGANGVLRIYRNGSEPCVGSVAAY